MTKPTMWLCAQRRLRSAWASAQSEQSLRCPHEERLDPYLPIERRAKALIRLGGWRLIYRKNYQKQNKTAQYKQNAVDFNLALSYPPRNLKVNLSTIRLSTWKFLLWAIEWALMVANEVLLFQNRGIPIYYFFFFFVGNIKRNSFTRYQFSFGLLEHISGFGVSSILLWQLNYLGLNYFKPPFAKKKRYSLELNF